MHLAKLNFKLVGSYALRCGCSHFGFKIIGFHSPLVQAVFVFKRKDKAQNFQGWLNAGGLVNNSDYTFQHRYHKGQFVYLVFLNTILFSNHKPNQANKFSLNIKKYYYKNFRQFCNQTAATLYQSNQHHLYNN